MHIPGIFKYSSLLSVPLFAVIALSLTGKTREYSLHDYTISQLIKFLTRSSHGVIFRLNFILKAVLDLGFSLYVLDFFRISLASPAALMLITSAVLFGSLAYFIEGKYSVLHTIIVYASGVLWVAGQILAVRVTGSSFFLLLSVVMLIIPLILGFTFLFLKKTNAFAQAACVAIWYTWLLILVFQYL